MKPLRWGVFLLLSFTATNCHKKESGEASGKESPPVSVTLAEAKMQTVPVFETVVGTVRPKHEATVSTEISGRILELRVVVGQTVNQGDIIARLEASELEASLARAEAVLEQAEREMARQQTLLESEVTSQTKFELAETAERVARASLRQIKASLTKSTILAPFSGTITSKLADTGDMATPGKPLVKLENPQSLRLEIQVPESLAGKLKLGHNLTIQIDSAGLDTQGAIGEIRPSADVSSRTFLVKIDLTESPALRSGQFGRARIPRGESPMLLIPAAAVVQRGQMEIAFINSDGLARLRHVYTVPHGKDQRAVHSGLSDGDQVVLSPDASLRDGTPLKTN